MPGSTFHVDLFQGGKIRQKLSKKQKRENNLQRQAILIKQPPDIFVAELEQLQQEDPTLSDIREAAANKTKQSKYFLWDGLLYRRWIPPDNEIPLAGHLGQKNTAERILLRFYWLTLFQDVREVCKACPECQRTASTKTVRAPMIPLPVIGEPFQRIAMDIVGPLLRSRQGHRYILIICDYATRYPEAFPLKTIDAPHVAEELMKFFSQVGVPKEILTDQGTNFMSKLLTELYRMLHVQPIRTSLYHFQTDGLVE